MAMSYQLNTRYVSQRLYRRRAFTLFELLIVAAIVVIIGALVYPAIANSTGTQNLIRSGDILRTHFARSRNEAMRSGQTLALRYELGGRQFIIEPWTTGDEQLEANIDSPIFNAMGLVAGDESSDRTISNRLLGKLKGLPDQVQFAGGLKQFDDREVVKTDPTLNPNSAQIDNTSMADMVSANWSEPVLFYPDGSTSQTEVRLASDDLQIFVLVRIRGLTGVAYVTGVMSQQEVSALDLERLNQ